MKLSNPPKDGLISQLFKLFRLEFPNDLLRHQMCINSETLLVHAIRRNKIKNILFAYKFARKS
jgi:hypothetical protein